MEAPVYRTESGTSFNGVITFYMIIIIENRDVK